MQFSQNDLYINSEQVYQALINCPDHGDQELPEAVHELLRDISARIVQLFIHELSDSANLEKVLRMKLRMLRDLEERKWIESVIKTSSGPEPPFEVKLARELEMYKQLYDSIRAYEFFLERIRTEAILEDKLVVLLLVEGEFPNAEDEFLDHILFGNICVGQLLTIAPDFLLRFARHEEASEEEE